ncbi:hypothetical protein BMH32_13670 [Leucobacter sp. OLJS4]|uniref:TadE family protein n=1 Tax=unclassified Leucobacter TaxID=2621730 RepID=UPI000C49549E|nr:MULTISPECIES: TadE family protein [unclassified Leucobacter]PII84807.1 hypothetical protein BMH25_03400 [Leucobacter sp. OLCALW19]PII87766.1 hypothetical protein BMH26_08460 [Leucobacter sp. OLTLW20]PII93854.1 hypothetical protein BMH27_02735 [Leucobacter sp. OLAS13]PII98477.1 hypothetical protein BMH29_08000 [Leucobacter sp. OLDS2]PIJ00458.1 hypothetical protein BMH28_09085 [Leucobacter sp. OLCS4]
MKTVTQAGSLRHDERGSVTAEFAVVMPAILAVLALVLGGIMLAGRRIELVSASAELARLEARGDTVLASERERRLPRGTSVSRERAGQLLCVHLRAAPGRGILSVLGISARACAAAHASGPGHGAASVDEPGFSSTARSGPIARPALAARSGPPRGGRRQ